jgi:hypothetical protein
LYNLHNCDTNFQEEIPLKLKSLVVITLLVLGCSAAFGQNLGFLDYTGGVEYCNWESLNIIPGYANFYVQGYDVLSSCPYSPVGGASINGFKISVPKTADAPLSGASYVYADQLYDAYYGFWTGLQWVVITKTKAPTKIKSTTPFSWAGYVGEVGYEFLGNYGFLSNTIPSADRVTKTKSTMSNMSMAKLKAKGEALKASHGTSLR